MGGGAWSFLVNSNNERHLSLLLIGTMAI